MCKVLLIFKDSYGIVNRYFNTRVTKIEQIRYFLLKLDAIFVLFDNNNCI